MELFFCGGAEEVGASCILIRIDGKNILLDCGIRLHSPDSLPDFRLIQENGGVEAIVITHAHLDHSGSLPVLSREYPQAPVFMTPPTRDLTRVLLYDSLKIMDREAEIPAYAPLDVEEMLARIQPRPFQFSFKPFADEEIEIALFPAGHILGAASVYVAGREGSLCYSGDISATPQRTVNGLGLFGLRPDVLVLESTYGDRLHSNRSVEEERLLEVVSEVTGEGGKVLVPAFALGRAQEVLLLLRSALNRKKLSHVPVYADGMVKDILRIYTFHAAYLRRELARRIWREKDVFYSEWVKPVESPEMRRKIVSDGDPCVIVASSGMLTGGPSCFYAEKLTPGRNNCIAITGYQDEEAPGRKLLELFEARRQGGKGDREWRLGDSTLAVSCRTGKYGLSAHADRGELLGLARRLNPRKLFLVHGSPEALSGLGREMQAQLRAQVFIPKNGGAYRILLRSPRKRLERSRLPSLGKGVLPGEEQMRELWSYLSGRERKSGYTAEELAYLWTGRRDFEEQELQEFRRFLLKERFFAPDERRLFLFHLLPEEEVLKPKEPEVMEVNEMLALADRLFPAQTGLYRKGARFEQKVVLLSFDFPGVQVPRCEQRIRELESLSGWRVETNTRSNLSALKPLLRELLAEQKHLLQKVSYYDITDSVAAELSAEPSGLEKLEQEFTECTGLELQIEYPGKQVNTGGRGEAPQALPQEPGDEPERLEQNAALSLIESAFREAKDTLYRKGIKGDRAGRYIELSFITPAVGERYRSWIEDLQRQTGWPIRIGLQANQAELIHRVLELLKEANLTPKKNPGVHQKEGVVRLKLAGAPEQDTWEALCARYEEETGFRLDYGSEQADR